MRNIVQVIAASVVGLSLALVVAGCGSSPTTGAKMGMDKMDAKDKMGGDHMDGKDKMGADKMDAKDKMSTDKMDAKDKK